MDRHKTQGNRHKAKEKFKSGREKRKIAKDKEKKMREELAKSRRMTDYMLKPSSSGSSSQSQISEDKLVPEILTEVFETSSASAVSETPSALPLPETPSPPAVSEASSAPAVFETPTAPTVPEPPSVPAVSESSVAPVLSLGSTSSENDYLENDIGLWPEILTQGNIRYCLRFGSTTYQNCDNALLDSKSFKQIDRSSSGKTFIRTCQTSLFVRKTQNNESVRRSWLCFSPSTGRVYCFFCRLFSQTHSRFTHGGYCDWKNAAARLIEHEISKPHLRAVIDSTARSKEEGRIDQELIKQAASEAKYWREVLRRLISVIVFISERGLAFRGENQTLGSPRNGNYLGILELIAEYDVFLKNHIKDHGNRGTGHTNYLSARICEEVVDLIGERVFSEVISRIKRSKYYSISLDSTPDEGHIDQLTLIFRYLEEHNPVERFLTFMPNQGHKAKDMFQSLKTFLKENDINIKDCRGQSYDNASSMSGKYNGLRALVLAENNLAIWIPCAGHSLNLVVQAAAESCLSAVSFFDFLEELYIYFTASTSRYKILTDCLEQADSENPILVPKRTTTTRWSSRADATKALLRGYKEIKRVLFKISEDKDDSGKSRITALSLHNKMCKMETAIYTVFWEDILGQINRTSETVQNPRLDVTTAVAALKSLADFIASKRENFEEYELKANGLIGSAVYEMESQRKRKISVRLTALDCAQAQEVEMTSREKFRTQSFLAVIDQFNSSLRQRLEAYNLVDARFGFLSKLGTLSNEEISAAAQNLIGIYTDDLDNQLENELIHFKSFCNEFKKDEENETLISQERWMYKLLLEKNVKDCFPNIEIALRMYLSLMVTNSSGERSFSKLKLIKNRLRTSMLQERLNVLALLSIECDILRQLNSDDIANDFINMKCRRKSIGLK